MSKKLIIAIILIILYITARKTYGYEYNGKDYNIYNPYTKQELSYAEYLYNTNKLDKNLYIYKLVNANIFCIKKGLKPLY